MPGMTRGIALATGVLLVMGLPPLERHPHEIEKLPRVMLWEWERPVDLRALPETTGVAFLAQTLAIDGETSVRLPRRQPLRVSPRTPLMAVTRLEARLRLPASSAGIDAVADLVARTARLPQVQAVQIDFDATLSQREGYRRLLHAVRRALPPRVPLSMTALASWCMQDDWLDDRPIDEAVPMLFRMGRSEKPFAARMRTMVRAPICRGAVGVSRDEPLPGGVSANRVYVFDTGGS